MIRMKISAEKMKYILKPGVKILSDIFTRNQFEIRISGGAVRDLLMDKIPKELDFATTATPTEMKKMFQVENVKIANNLPGERHGTITAWIEEENFECTTLRIDKATDGRHAEVEFIRDWETDARRRDLTINAMFLGLDGIVYDYFGGVKHLEENVITFVGDPDRRIREDYLRILRYFRFFGRISKDPNNHQPEVLAAIKKNCDGLSQLSGQRIWIEFRKILIGRYCCEVVAKMMECGVAVHIGLPEEFSCENMTKVYNRLASQEFQPCTLLAAGMASEQHAITFINRMKFSNKEKENLLFIIKYREQLSNWSVKDLRDSLVDMVYKEKRREDAILIAVTELIKYVGREDLSSEDKDIIPRFPVKGGCLKDKIEKKDIQKEMNRLFEIWKESNYSLSREELLDKVR